MKKGFVVAIDGPVASGKGTIAKRLSNKIHAVNFNTGGMWRALGLKCQNEHLNIQDSVSLISLITPEHIDLKYYKTSVSNLHILLDGLEVTDQLNTPELGVLASQLAQDVRIQKKMIELVKKKITSITDDGHPVIVEGRQIGTEVSPDAELKIFLTASLSIRARRRFHQYSLQGVKKTLNEVIADTKNRDNRDITRPFGALVTDPENHGYVVIDNSAMDEKETLSVVMIELVKKKLV